MMPAWLLGPRRIWWFLTDWQTNLVFTWPCGHCGDTMALEGTGFRVPHYLKHRNPLCRYQPVLRHEFSALWFLCWPCIHLAWIRWSFFVVCRWRFRLKYTWGVGVDPRCLAGEHDWPTEKDAYVFYEVDGKASYTGECKRCHFRHRWLEGDAM